MHSTRLYMEALGGPLQALWRSRAGPTT